VSWLVRQVDLALALLELDLSSGACVHLRLGRSPCKGRLDFICVSCLGFLLRTARRRPISSTLPILVWICAERVIELLHLGCVAWNSRGSHLLIVVRCDCGWKNLSRVWIALTVSRSLTLQLLLLVLD